MEPRLPGITEDQAKNGILRALERHRRAALSGDVEAVIDTLDRNSPHFELIGQYFGSRTRDGYDRYDCTVRELVFHSDYLWGTVEIDAVLGFVGFAASDMRYRFTFRRSSDDEWHLYNVREFRLHLLSGYGPETLDSRPIVVVGSSPAGQRLGRWLAGHLDTDWVPAERFTGSWNDVLVVDRGDNPVAQRLKAPVGVSAVHGVPPCHRWAVVISVRDDDPEEQARDRAVALLEEGRAPELSLDHRPPGESEWLCKCPVPGETVPQGEPRWLQEAAGARDPAPATDYARAVLKWYRFLLQDAILDSAVMAANMMTERQVILARRLAGPGPRQTLRNLALFAQAHLEHQQDHFTDPSQPFGSAQMYPTNPSIGCDEMLAFFPELYRAYGMCGPLQYFNQAVLRLSGVVPPDDLVQIRIAAGDLKHEVSCLVLGDANYLCTGIEYLEMDDNFYRFSRVTHVISDRHFRAGRGTYNMSDNRLLQVFERLVKPLSHNFNLADEVRVSRPEDYRPDLVFGEIRHTVRDCTDDQELADRVRAEIFARSRQCPDSHYTYAKYAYQTIYVTRPEAYAVSSTMGPLASRKARQFSRPEQALAWMHEHIGPGGIYAEGHRLQMADQVLVYRRGTPRDRAMLGYAMARALGVNAYIVLGRKGGWLLWDDGRTRLWDCGEGRFTSAVDEPPVVVFNGDCCHFPAVGREDLDGEIAAAAGILR